MSALTPCRSRRLPPRLFENLTISRLGLIDREQRGNELPIMFPTDAYATVFLRGADPIITKSIETIRRDRERNFLDNPGVIYVFWVRGQPINEVKIGRSINKAERRAADWSRVIAPTGSKVKLLFSFQTRYNALAEQIIHATLAAEQIEKLKHPTTGRALTEFFRVDNILLLRLFILLCIRYSDALGDEIVRNKQQT